MRYFFPTFLMVLFISVRKLNIKFHNVILLYVLYLNVSVHPFTMNTRERTTEYRFTACGARKSVHRQALFRRLICRFWTVFHKEICCFIFIKKKNHQLGLLTFLYRCHVFQDDSLLLLLLLLLILFYLSLCLECIKGVAWRAYHPIYAYLYNRC